MKTKVFELLFILCKKKWQILPECKCMSKNEMFWRVSIDIFAEYSVTCSILISVKPKMFERQTNKKKKLNIITSFYGGLIGVL